MKYFLLRNTQSVYIKEYIKSHCFLKLVLYTSYHPKVWQHTKNLWESIISGRSEGWLQKAGNSRPNEVENTEQMKASSVFQFDTALSFLSSLRCFMILHSCSFPSWKPPWMFVVIGLRSCLEYRNIILCFEEQPRDSQKILGKNNMIISIIEEFK